MYLKAKKKIKTNKKDIIRFLLLLFLAFALMPDFISIGEYSLKPMYSVLGILVLILVKRRDVVFPPKIISIFLSFALIISMVMSFFWGIDRLFFNYCFGSVVSVITMTFVNKYCENDWLKILQKVWILLFLAVIINNLRQFFRFQEYFYYKWDHPYINTVVTGGVNLEATWISILTLSFYNRKGRWKAYLLSALISLLYASRVGIIANIIVAFSFMYGERQNETKKELKVRRVYFSLLIIVGIIISAFISIKFDITVAIISRFKNIGHDFGSLGRFAMWKYIPKLIMTYPLGVGLGNSIPALSTVSPLKYGENNLHNIFFQMFCEIGVFGGIFFLILWITFFFEERSALFKSPISNMLAIYAFLSLFQFRGGETIFFGILGMYFASKRNKACYAHRGEIHCE